MHFKPAWWLRNPHLQTVWPRLFRKALKNLFLTSERVELPDGDFVDLEWAGEGRGPLVLILHGFEGSIHSHYAKGLLSTITKQGWRGVFMHFRGCSGVPNRLPRSYHSADTGDLAFIVNMLRQREPDVSISAIGISLGGNVLLKWLGESVDKNPLTAAIAVSVPFELKKTALHIQKGMSRLYQWHLLKTVIKRMEQQLRVTPPALKLPCLNTLQTLEAFDNLITAPLHGFQNSDEYYSIASSRQYLRGIQVPTLIIHAKDDPFMTLDAIPHANEVSTFVQLEIQEAGGHVGFVGGKVPWRAEYWLESRIGSFLQEHLPSRLLHE